MNWNIRELKARAAALAAENRSAVRRLVLLYCGVVAALTLGSSGLNLYLDSQIGGTGGLTGLGTRSVLQTIQELLSYVNMYFGPFWSAGFLAAMIGMVRGRAPENRDLTEGFRRFFRILGHLAFRFLVVVLLGTVSMNLGAVLFIASPLGSGFTEAMEPILTDPNLFLADGSINMDLIPQDLLIRSGLPLTLIILAVFCLLYLYLGYHFRLSMYLVMDRPIGAVAAHFLSVRLMRGHKWQMLKMDLSYWWYYLLMLVIGVVGYLDVILSLLGLPLPMDPTVMFFLTLGAYCVLNMGLSLWQKARVDASYVLAYEHIANPEPVQTAE